MSGYGIESIISLSEPKRKSFLNGLTDEEALVLSFDWEFWARDNQKPPPEAGDDWRMWVVQSGRGFGKTRIGGEMVRDWANKEPGARIALVGRTRADCRDVMIEGESGILSICPPWDVPRYDRSKLRLTWPNGSMASSYSTQEPNALRGPQHHFAWWDEMASSIYAQDTLDNLMLGLRLGDFPKLVATTTPRPVRIVRERKNEVGTFVTYGSTYDNRLNLPPAFFQSIQDRYSGTTLGRQEIYGELLEELPGALWKRSTLQANRVAKAPELQRVAVAIDPAVTATEEASETGIVAGGVDDDGHGYVLADSTCRLSPDGWARRAIELYHSLKADFIIAEKNQGGDMVRHTLRTVDPDVPVKLVTATRGKRTRAEPIAALDEQGRIHHVGNFPDLEDQLCSWEADSNQASPDRLDARVWLFSVLMLGSRPLEAW